MINLSEGTPGGHTLPPLPYSYDALEPFLSAETIRIHHDILQQNYVNGQNKAEEELFKARKNNDFSLIKNWENELAYNGSGNLLHSIYFNSMVPMSQSSYPGNSLMSEIINAFGNFDDFKNQFSAAAEKTEGSAWSALCWHPTLNKLVILQVKNHQNGTIWGAIPILLIDVWEHAYYIDYKNKRPEYIKNFWDYVNWDGAEKRLALAKMGLMPETV